MYRIYNTKEQKWMVRSDIYLSPCPYNDLYILKRNIFGIKKLKLVPNDEYVIHKYTGILDKDKFLVFEGDYIKALVSEDRTVIGLVVFAPELASYIILCNDSDEYFTLGTQVSEYIEVIGNVFDGYGNREE